MGEAVPKTGDVKFPIGVKLALIIGFIVLVSLGSVTIISTLIMGKDVKVTAENNNLSLNTRSASTVEDKLSSIKANVSQLLDLIGVVSGGRKYSNARQATTLFLERNPEIAAIYVLSENGIDRRNSSDDRIVNAQFFISNEIESTVINEFLSARKEDVVKSIHGETIALNLSPFFGLPVMGLLFPWKENGRDQTCIIIFSIESLSEILGTGSGNTTFMINNLDEIISHPDVEKVLAGTSYTNHELVKKIRESSFNNLESMQVPYKEKDENGKKTSYFGAYRKLNIADIVIITTVSYDTALEGVRKTRQDNIYLMLVIFFLSIIFVLIFAKVAISIPLTRLSDAAMEIQDGNFDTPIISKLNTKRQDEIGVLNKSTQNEREFLDTFAKFTNKGVAKAIARKEIDFEPHLKDITIFFSDIRGFTAISDGFKNKFGNDSPREIIGFLNDYMGRMVNCISLSHGNVDKFEGDAIMAVWGILRDEDLSFENLPDSDPKKKELAAQHAEHVKEDALNAIRGTIAMRYALMKYNKDAEAFTKQHENEPNAKYKPHIRIGCGLNTGRATAGIMGGQDKMEYTAIGDAVNFASRTESSNKPCGTDILITEDTREILKSEIDAGRLVIEQIPVEFEVKGKGAQHFYGVVNMPEFNLEEFFKAGDKDFVLDKDCEKAVGPKGPKTLNEVRAMLGIPIPEFEKVDLNEEENKIQVKK